jgi:hypothetical protein
MLALLQTLIITISPKLKEKKKSQKNKPTEGNVHIVKYPNCNWALHLLPSSKKIAILSISLKVNSIVVLPVHHRNCHQEIENEIS